MNDLPKFDAPPVVEAVLGVQFTTLERLSAAHIGWYWRDCLARDWIRVLQARPLDEIVEQFGEPEWVTPGLRLSEAPNKVRLQFFKPDAGRMVQVQDSRFHYNWRRHGGEYPTFDTLYPEFEERFNEFRSFLQRNEIGTIEPNHWEVTYVNHIPRGSLWDRGQDWQKISSSLFPPCAVPDQTFEAARCNWRFRLGDSAGRLHVSSNYGLTQQEDERREEVVILQLTARGPVQDERDFKEGLHLGHDHLVRFFACMTSEDAHAAWKRKR